MVGVGGAGVHALTTQGYTSAEDIKPGSLVSTDENDAKQIQLANQDRAKRLLGVAVNPGDAAINLSTGAKEVQVATSDTVKALVSTVNGDVKAGDLVAPTFINGVGGKAVVSMRVIGSAQAEVTGSTEGATKETVATGDGKSQEVSIAAIPVRIQLSDFVAPDPDKSVVPKFIQELSNAIAGKKVATARILIGAAILIIAIIAVSALIYAATRSSIISIGRNPLSKSAVQRSLIQIFILVVIILGTALISIYIIFTG